VERKPFFEESRVEKIIVTVFNRLGYVTLVTFDWKVAKNRRKTIGTNMSSFGVYWPDCLMISYKDSFK